MSSKGSWHWECCLVACNEQNGNPAAICPLHAWKVNMENGCVQRPAGAEACVETYPTRVEDDIVMVAV